MSAKAKPPQFPMTVIFGSGRIRIREKPGQLYDLVWRECGENRKTSKSGSANAIEWANEKVRELDSASGNQWIARGESEALEKLRAIAGTEDGAIRRLLDDIRDARRWLDGAADLTTAARWYAEHGPLKVERTTLAAAMERFLAEYTVKETRRTFAQELEPFVKTPGNEKMLLLDVDETRLTAWTNRKVNNGQDKAAERTVDNRITTWITFMNRCRDWKLLPQNGKHAADLVKRPTVPDPGKEIFTVDQGGALLAAVREHDASTPQEGKQLEAYLLIGGWLGLRPSEIQRITWESFDWERRYCHVTVEVAQKNSSERYIPMDERLANRLRSLFIASRKKVTAKCCAFRCREFLSVLAREKGICDEWPTDVLRHSFCSYRIAVVKSLEQVATEADNSVPILKSNYRRPLRHEDGLAWWNLLDSISPEEIRQAA